MNKLIPLLFIILLSACANPINLHTGREYFQGGQENAKEGRWFNARMAFGRAWTNANLGKEDDKITAVYAYEYGRASGAICDWTEAERGLKHSYEPIPSPKTRLSDGVNSNFSRYFADELLNKNLFGVFPT